MMNKLERIKFTDHSIDKIKFDDLEFSYIKDGHTKGRDRLWNSFEVGKKSSLKGLKLCIHRSTRNKLTAETLYKNLKSVNKRVSPNFSMSTEKIEAESRHRHR